MAWLEDPHCQRCHTTNYAFDYPLFYARFNGNSVHPVGFNTRVPLKAISDYSKDPVNTSFVFVLPNWTISQWYTLLDHFDVFRTFPKGPNICT